MFYAMLLVNSINISLFTLTCNADQRSLDQCTIEVFKFKVHIYTEKHLDKYNAYSDDKSLGVTLTLYLFWCSLKPLHWYMSYMCLRKYYCSQHVSQMIIKFLDG